MIKEGTSFFFFLDLVLLSVYTKMLTYSSEHQPLNTQQMIWNGTMLVLTNIQRPEVIIRETRTGFCFPSRAYTAPPG